MNYLALKEKVSANNGKNNQAMQKIRKLLTNRAQKK